MEFSEALLGRLPCPLLCPGFSFRGFCDRIRGVGQRRVCGETMHEVRILSKQTNGLRLQSGSLRRNVSAWMLMIPSLILFAFFVWGPLIDTVKMSFYDTKGIQITKFVGLKNYKKLLVQPAYQIAWKNTVKYTVCSLFVGLAVPVIIASLITEVSCGRGFFRIATYYPNVIPSIAAVMIFTFFFGTGDKGVLNILLAKIGVEPVKFLTNEKWVIFWIVVAMTWKAAGSTALVYMSSISSIPQELYEAATVDGASPIRRFFSITMPTVLHTGSFIPLWLSMGANAYWVILFKNYFESLPKDFIDAARLDGCSDFRVFTRIILPLSRPILVVVAIFAICAAWSDFLMPYLLLGGTDKETVMVKLFSFQNSIKTNQTDIIRAVLYSVIPPTILFALFQKQIMGGVMSGGIKE